MARTDEVREFVRQALGHGLARTAIQQALEQAGWRPEQVRKALSTYADLPFAVPVPRPTAYLSPRDAFLYLTLYLTLYLSAFHLGSLLFSLVDSTWPDAADPAMASLVIGEGIRSSVAFLVVTFPTWIGLTWRIERALARDPSQRQAPIRQWLAYMTLFTAGAVLIGDAVALVRGLLGGDLEVRFGLKTAIVAALAGACLVHIRRGLGRDTQESQP
jgi:hypothetical protein